MNQERGQKFLLELPAIQNDLPFSPTLLPRLFSLTGDEAASPLTLIAEAIAEDQGLSTRLLAMANSAFYGLQSQVGTVSRAVAVLGLREVRGMVLLLGMRGLAGARALPAGFALPPYLEHQTAVAVAAMALARETRAMDPDDAFTAGVLHDLGKLLTALYRPADWLAQAALAEAAGISWHEAEERHWGLDHGLIGAMVLRAWNLPECLTEPVNWHHVPHASPASRRQAGLIGLADACVRELAGEPQPGILMEAVLADSGLPLSADAARNVTQTALDERDPGHFADALCAGAA